MSLDEVTVAPEASRRWWSRVPRPRLVTAVVVLVLLVWWATPKSLLGNSGDPMYAGVGPEVGVPAYIDLGLSPSAGDGPLHILWARPNVTIGAGHTRADLVVCGVGPEGGVGIVYGDVSAMCIDERPAAGATARPGDQVLLRVVSDSTWPTVVDGVAIAYVDAWRPGVQRAALPVVMEAVEATP
jgi:hypothetical protein